MSTHLNLLLLEDSMTDAELMLDVLRDAGFVTCRANAQHRTAPSSRRRLRRTESSKINSFMRRTLIVFFTASRRFRLFRVGSGQTHSNVLPRPPSHFLCRQVCKS